MNFDYRPPEPFYNARRDPRIIIPIFIVIAVSALLSGGLVHLSQKQKAKRQAAEAMPTSVVMIDEMGNRSTVKLKHVKDIEAEYVAPKNEPKILDCPTSLKTETSPVHEGAWIIPPRALESDYPEAALLANISGQAEVMCDGMPDGRVIDCITVSETPEGYGFGLSAMHIVQRGCLRPFQEENGPRRFTARVPFILD